MGGLGDERDEFACCKTIKGERDEEIVKEIQERERVKFSQKLREGVESLKIQLNYEHPNMEESRRKVVERVMENNPEDFVDKPIKWINGLPDGKAEMYIPTDGIPQDILSGLSIEEGKKITGEWSKVEENEIKPVTNPLNKVRDFFGLETADLTKVKTDTLLMKSAEKFKTKNAEHGDAYLKVGVILNQFFPNGITLKSIHEFNKFVTLVQMIYKLTRMCNTCFDKDKKLIHDSEFDSPQDLGIYGHMFNEIQIKEIIEDVGTGIGVIEEYASKL